MRFCYEIFHSGNFNCARNYRVSRKTTHYVVRVMCSYLIDILQCSYIQALELYLFSRLKIYLYQYFYFLAVNIFLDSISVTNGQHPWDDSRASAWRWYPCLNFCWMTEPRSICIPQLHTHITLWQKRTYSYPVDVKLGLNLPKLPTVRNNWVSSYTRMYLRRW